MNIAITTKSEARNRDCLLKYINLGNPKGGAPQLLFISVFVSRYFYNWSDYRKPGTACSLL